jgi:hypothetical protein
VRNTKTDYQNRSGNQGTLPLPLNKYSRPRSQDGFLFERNWRGMTMRISSRELTSFCSYLSGRKTSWTKKTAIRYLYTHIYVLMSIYLLVANQIHLGSWIRINNRKRKQLFPSKPTAVVDAPLTKCYYNKNFLNSHQTFFFSYTLYSSYKAEIFHHSIVSTSFQQTGFF